MDNQDFNQSIYAFVRSQDQIIFQGSIKSLTSLNDKGVFDVLPEHTNFISLIKDYIIIHHKQEKDQIINLKKAILHIYDNKIYVYIVL